MANMIVAQLLYLDAVDPTKVCILPLFYVFKFVVLYIAVLLDAAISIFDFFSIAV